MPTPENPIPTPHPAHPVPPAHAGPGFLIAFTNPVRLHRQGAAAPDQRPLQAPGVRPRLPNGAWVSSAPLFPPTPPAFARTGYFRLERTRRSVAPPMGEGRRLRRFRAQPMR